MAGESFHFWKPVSGESEGSEHLLLVSLTEARQEVSHLRELDLQLDESDGDLLDTPANDGEPADINALSRGDASADSPSGGEGMHWADGLDLDELLAPPTALGAPAPTGSSAQPPAHATAPTDGQRRLTIW